MAIPILNNGVFGPREPARAVNILGFQGNGYNFGTFIIICDEQYVPLRGQVLGVGKHDVMVYDYRWDEDFFEHIHQVTCVIITNDPTQVIDTRVKTGHYMYSSHINS
jgi:hypothetical protein